jgi:hypothetical protein
MLIDITVEGKTVHFRPLVLAGYGIEIKYHCHDTESAKALAIVLDAAVAGIEATRKDTP